ERDVLPERQTNNSAERQLLSRKIRLERDEAKPLRLQFHLTAIDVNPRVDARLVLARRLLVHGSRRLELSSGRIDASGGRGRLQVRSADRKDDEVAIIANAVPRGGGGFFGGAIVPEGREIEDALTQHRARVEIVERAEHARKLETRKPLRALKSNCRET